MATIIPPQPNTEDMLTLLSAYLDGEVTPAERAQVEQALAHSPEMARELAELRQTVSLVSALPKMAAPRPFTLTLADVTPSVPPRQQRRWFAVPMWAGGLAAMAAVLACVLAAGGLFINRQMEGATMSMAPAAEVARQDLPQQKEAAAPAMVTAPAEINRSEAALTDELAAPQPEAAPAEPEMADEAAQKEAPVVAAAPPPAPASLPTELEAESPPEESAVAQKSLDLAAETPAQTDLAGAAPAAEETTMMSAAADTAGKAGEIAAPSPTPTPAVTIAASPTLPKMDPSMATITASTPTMDAPAATEMASPPAPEEAPKRQQIWLLLISLIVLIALLLGVWLILNRKKGRGQ